ncbi:MAG: hypothetical protein CMJ54_04430, partial [Planctomycetaceae bacterium]|nr:hypothetical protein [Planctomycetaceae bacterium]
MKVAARNPDGLPGGRSSVPFADHEPEAEAKAAGRQAQDRHPPRPRRELRGVVPAGGQIRRSRRDQPGP